jgi:hypothetical protein
VPGEYQPMGSHLSFHPREGTVWEENGGPGLDRILPSEEFISFESEGDTSGWTE